MPKGGPLSCLRRPQVAAYARFVRRLHINVTAAKPPWEADLDNECAQLTSLQDIMEDPEYKTRYAKPVRRAIDTAYASHYRALLEFFHDGRQSGKPQPTDLLYRDVSGSTSPFLPWSKFAKGRLDDADKLVGHLTKVRRTKTSDWGSSDDWAFIWPMIQKLLKITPGDWFPETRQAVSQRGLTA